MFLVTMFRLFKSVLYFGSPLVYYARLAWSKVWPETPPMRRMQMQRGQGLVEYALVLVLVAIVVIAILTVLGPQVGEVFFKVQCTLASGSVTESTSYIGRLDCVDPGAPVHIFGDVIGFFEPNGNVEWVQ